MLQRADPVRSVADIGGTYYCHDANGWGGDLWLLLAGDEPAYAGHVDPNDMVRIEPAAEGVAVTHIVGGVEREQRRVPVQFRSDGYVDRPGRSGLAFRGMSNAFTWDRVAVGLSKGRELVVCQSFGFFGAMLVIPIGNGTADGTHYTYVFRRVP